MASSLSMSETRDDRVLRTFGMAYGISYLLYNVTEATFQGLNFLFIVFLVLAFHYPRGREAARPGSNRLTAVRRPERAGVRTLATASYRR